MIPLSLCRRPRVYFRKAGFPVCLFLFLFILSFRAGAQSSTGSAQSSTGIDSTNWPVLWLRADKTIITDTSWTDFSGNRRAAIPFNKQRLKRDALLNYNPAITFNGVDDSMKIGYNLDSLSDMTIIAVYQPADTTEAGVWGTGNALARNIMATTRQVTGPDSTPVNIGNNGKYAILSTVMQHWTRTATVNPLAYMTLGSTGKQNSYLPFKGAVAELLVFNKSLDLLTQIQYETYLAIKYGMPLSQGNYVSATENVLWDAEQNSDYKYRIAGLGKEPFFSLDQKQSGSSLDTDSLLAVSVGNLAKTNPANTDSIPNGNYLVWGDNNNALKTSTSPDGQLDIADRKWLMNVSGDSASALKTSLRLNLKQVPPYPKGYWLVINPGGTKDFLVDNLLYQQADSLSGDSVAFYKNVRWDQDHSGKDGFSFAQAKDLLVKINVLDSPSCKIPMAGRAGIQVISGHGPFTYKLVDYTKQTTTSGWMADSNRNLELANLSAGKYQILVTDAQGHQAARPFSLTVPNALPIDLGPDQVLSPGGEIVLDASQNIPAGAAGQYQWHSSYGFSATGPVITVKEAGIYTVTATNTEGCVFQDSIVISGAGQQRFEVFPAPVTDGTYNISVSLPQKGPVSIAVYDLNGHKQDEMQGRNNAEYHFQRHISTPGFYMVNLKTAKGAETKKILVL